MYQRLLRFGGLNKITTRLGSRVTMGQVHQVLVEQGALDVCAIKVPEDRKVYEYFVVCSARTNRHLSTIPNALEQLKVEVDGKKAILEGTKANDGWSCADLGDIIIHVFEDEQRKIYDLETLWALGEDFDSKFNLDQSDLDQILNMLKSEQERVNNEEEFDFDAVFEKR